MAHTKNVSGPAAGSGGSLGGDGGGDPPRRLSAAEKGKGKKLATKKQKASDRDAEVAEAVAAAAEAAERVGRSGALRIGDDLMPRQRRAVLETEGFHGSPPGTVTIGGQVLHCNPGGHLRGTGSLSGTIQGAQCDRPRDTGERGSSRHSLVFHLPPRTSRVTSTPRHLL
jgi:hypothetical protein